MSPIPTPHSPQHGRILSVRHSVFAVLGLCFVTVMVAIDQTVVGTALPTVVAELNGFKLYAWVATAYLLHQWSPCRCLAGWVTFSGASPLSWHPFWSLFQDQYCAAWPIQCCTWCWHVPYRALAPAWSWAPPLPAFPTCFPIRTYACAGKFCSVRRLVLPAVWGQP